MRMRRFRDLPIRVKLTLVLAFTSAVSLLTAGMVLIAIETAQVRPVAVATAHLHADMVAFSAAAGLAFHDALDATNALRALQADATVEAAALYASDGRLVAGFLRPGRRQENLIPPIAPPAGDAFEGESLLTVRPVADEGTLLGSVFIRTDLRPAQSFLRRQWLILGLLIAAGVPVALLMGSYLQRIVIVPLQRLSAAAADLSRGNGAVFLPEEGERGDELGVLVNAFQSMVRALQERERKLSEARDTLERRVAERTAALLAINRSMTAEIAARKAAEGQLIGARDAAESASRAKSTFLANMSHELRTPLTAIIGYSEMLQEDAQERGDGQLLDDLGRIRSAGQHLLRLISDLLDLSKIEAGKMRLHVERFDLDALIRESIASVRPVCEVNANHLRFVCVGELRSMVSDRTRLKQVLDNLLANAAKFTRRGHIQVTASRARDASGEEWVELIVADTGIGMNRAQLGRLFQPFVQADRTTSLHYGGTGLGLTICKRCCDLMGGAIEVMSEEGRGSSFVVRVPAVIEQPEEVGDEASRVDEPVERGASV